MSMNTVCRGGHYQTRPGTKILACLAGDNMQGSTFFVPSNGGAPAHIVAIDGKIFVAQSPFRDYVQLNGLQFFPQSKNVSFTVCEQSTDFTAGGDFYFLAQPKTVVIMQDGITRAAYWDGVTAAHINPTPSPTTVTVEGFDGTRIGLWSVWSNNRGLVAAIKFLRLILAIRLSSLNLSTSMKRVRSIFRAIVLA